MCWRTLEQSEGSTFCQQPRCAAALWSRSQYRGGNKCLMRITDVLTDTRMNSSQDQRLSTYCVLWRKIYRLKIWGLWEAYQSVKWYEHLESWSFLPWQTRQVQRPHSKHWASSWPAPPSSSSWSPSSGTLPPCGWGLGRGNRRGLAWAGRRTAGWCAVSTSPSARSSSPCPGPRCPPPWSRCLRLGKVDLLAGSRSSTGRMEYTSQIWRAQQLQLISTIT